MVRARQRGRGLESDAPMEAIRSWFCHEVVGQEGRPAALLLSEAEALEAAGLRE